MAEKNSFVVYTDIRNQTRLLTLEQTGRLFLSMLDYAEGIQPEFTDALVEMAFSCVKTRMDYDRQKWEDTCRKRQEAGKKGGRPRKNQTAESGEYSPADGGGDFLPKKRKVFEKPESVYESVYESESDLESVPVPVKDSQPDAPVENLPDRPGCEKDYQDALAYAKKAGYTFTQKQRKKLRYFVNVFSFEVVIMAIERAVFHGGKSPTYVLRILQEWRDKRLCDVDAITAYVERREGGGAA